MRAADMCDMGRLDMTQDMPEVRTRLQGPLRLAALAAPLLLAGLAAWAALTPIRRAVIAPGTTMVAGENRKVQHLDGGIVRMIGVKNGDRVQAGQVVMQLDPTRLQNDVGIVLTRLAGALALQARLRAEERASRGAAPVLDPAAALASAAARTTSPADGAALHAALLLALEEQGRILAARAEVQSGQRAQTAERVAQLRGQTAGLDGLITAKEAQLGYQQEDLGNLQRLVDQGLAARPRLLEAEQFRSQILGELAQHRAERAGLANSIRDAELEQARAEASSREQVATDLRDAGSQVEELAQQLVTYRAQLERTHLRAPVAGIVHQLAVTTLGEVIAPGDTVMEIVPLGEGVEFDLRLQPQWIDEIRPGQAARLKFSGYAVSAVSEIAGEVTAVSPGTVEDPRTGISYYRLQIAIPPEELARLPKEPVPGMPVEAFLETGERTALNWLVKPLLDHLGRAFREE